MGTERKQNAQLAYGRITILKKVMLNAIRVASSGRRRSGGQGLSTVRRRGHQDQMLDTRFVDDKSLPNSLYLSTAIVTYMLLGS